MNLTTLELIELEVMNTIDGTRYDVVAVECICAKYGLVSDVVHAGIRYLIITRNQREE